MYSPHPENRVACVTGQWSIPELKPTVPELKPTAPCLLNADSFSSHSEADSDVGRHAYGYLFPGSPLTVEAPLEFFDPLTGSLMMEPVKLVNTNCVFDRSSLQAWYRKSVKDVNARCPLTGERLKGWITIETNDGLRRRIAAWANKHKFNLELISSLSNSQRKQRARPFPSLPPTCTQCKQDSTDPCLMVKACRPRSRSLSSSHRSLC